MVPFATRRYRCLGTALLAVAALGVAATAGSAGAETVAPEAPAPETAPVEPPKVKLVFPTHSTKVSGPGALVSVRCAGSGARSCIGTLALKARDGVHEVAYEVQRGERRMLVVPLGGDGDIFARAESAQAVARTLQTSGSVVRTQRVLRIR